MSFDLSEEIELMCSKQKLSEVAKKDFLLFISRISNEKQAELLTLFKKNPDWIFKIANNLQAKKKAFNKKDKKAWNEIIKKEKIDLFKIEDAK